MYMYMCTHQVLVGVSQSGLEGSGQLPQGGLDELGLRDDFLDLRQGRRAGEGVRCMYMRKGLGSHPGLNREPLTLAVSALPPELWPPGDSQPSQFSISLCMCRQNPASMYMYTCTCTCTCKFFACVHNEC